MFCISFPWSGVYGRGGFVQVSLCPRFASLLLLCLVAVSGVWALPENRSTGIALEIAPLNPAFQAFAGPVTAPLAERVGSTMEVLGYIPSPLDRAYLKGVTIPRGALATVQAAGDSSGNQGTESASAPYPGAFDLRTVGKVSPVKNQGSCGDCWAFATYGSLESTLLPGHLFDFSENNLKDTHGFDPGPCDGGNADMSTAYLARWSGPVDEAADPYSATGTQSPAGLPPEEHVQEVSYLPPRASSLDNGNIKGALAGTGAVYTSLYWSSSAYNSSSASYYYPGTTSSNHAVTIVGWDDGYDRNLFTPPAPGNGAFVVKNSWGTSWGSSGYFRVSYYDSQIGSDNAVFTAEDSGNYDHVYQYDPLGWTRSVGLGLDTAWFGNVFTSSSDENVEAVSFYTPQVNSSFRVSVYRDPATGSLASGGPASNLTGLIPVPGYHTVVLPQAVPVKKGETFSVVVRLQTPGYRYPVAVEAPISGYSGQATAAAGQSWVSSDGISWRDLTTISPGSNACLKAFTRVKETLLLPVMLPFPPRPPRMRGTG